MRIGIVTLAGRFNYGNRLQAYATQRVLAKRGFDVVTLEARDQTFTRRVMNMAKKVLRKPVSVEETLSEGRSEAFERFNSRIATKMTLIRDIHHDAYDCFVAGSDQVWNPSFVTFRHPEMLTFAPPAKRVALAASIGVSQIPEEDRDWIAREVSGFAHISVRERRALEIVRELTGRDAELVIDPTLAIDRESWLGVADDRITPSGSYVFTYLLGGVGEDARRVLNEVIRDGLSVIALTDREGPNELPAGPAEFISLIANASHVVTDSFHASAFALLMGTPLTIVRRMGSSPDRDMFSRLESLSHTLGLERNVYDSSNFDFFVTGDYARSYELLAMERKRLDAFLTRSLPRV
ncbi:MAG: polysaccharide pyruvyl transferase family protein [Atopobiaceae bacterium]|nr:polysaccharide pyruvyl transferase family protein [Atopobiaceae bacterium]